ncbi:MAG TPA: hypothetical protein VF772_10850 [Terriglobales bacterium]
MVDSDDTCPECQAGLEQFRPNPIFTYNFPDKHLGGVTYYGGYSESVVVDQRFVLHVSSNLNPAGAAPLLCAGITTYSPMRHWGVTKGKKVGVVGLGDLSGLSADQEFQAGLFCGSAKSNPYVALPTLHVGASTLFRKSTACAIAARVGAAVAMAFNSMKS